MKRFKTAAPLLTACLGLGVLGCGQAKVGDGSITRKQKLITTAGLDGPIALKPSGLCLTVGGNTGANGSPIIQAPCNQSALQSWKLSSPNNDGKYTVVNDQTGKCLDVPGGRTDNGIKLIQWACWGGANQSWTLQDLGNNFSSLQSAGTGKCVDLPAGTTDNGAAIQQWDCFGNDNQSLSLTGSVPPPPPPGGGPVWPTSGDVMVDWTHSLRNIDSKAYGVDCPACFVPESTSNPDFIRALKTLTGSKGLIRMHGWGSVAQGTPDGWLNGDGSWNAPKIASALKPLIDAGLGPQLLINIPAGPSGDKVVMDPNFFAGFTSSLVRIVNVDNHFGVKYFELPNEQEQVYSTGDMATLVSASSRAMKGVDPSILVGGPATAWVNYGYIVSVVQNALSDIDFVSVHTYGGDGSQSDAATYQSANGAVNDVGTLRSQLDGVTNGRHLPIFLDEYNVGWNYAPQERDNRGAVYDAMIQVGVVAAGGDASAAWSGMAPTHDMSLVDPNLNFYVTGNLTALMNQFAQGTQLASSVSDGSLTAFATRDAANGFHTLVIANRGGARNASISFNGFTTPTLTKYEINSNGLSGPTSVDAAGVAANGVFMQGQSIVIFVATGS